MAAFEAVAALVDRARAMPWFAAVGAPLGATERGAAVDAGADHPFGAKFGLFEAGRWPLGIVAGHFRLF